MDCSITIMQHSFVLVMQNWCECPKFVCTVDIIAIELQGFASVLQAFWTRKNFEHVCNFFKITCKDITNLCKYFMTCLQLSLQESHDCKTWI